MTECAADISTTTSTTLSSETRKRIRCKCRMTISPLIPSPLLRDAITAVDEIVCEEHQRLKVRNLVSDDDDDDIDSEDDDMQLTL
mmetsp:Transcript_26374/g.35137  ORF Transcript_26374/g.35137 Transcript_26374/m.35137 type:complete len:85 (+) Transcript_26374:158-412(+)